MPISTKFYLGSLTYLGDLNALQDEADAATAGLATANANIATNTNTIAGLRAVRQNAIRGGDASTNPWQRGVTFNGLGAVTQYTADGWLFSNNTTGVVNFSKAANAPTVAQAGKLITDCFQFQVATADAAMAAGEIATFQQRIEGYVWRRLAQRATGIRFWHNHSKAGTHCAAFRSGGSDRSYVVEYTQQNANTWEESVIDLPASPAAGTWNYTNGLGLLVDFVLAAGAGVQTATPNTWVAANALTTANQVNNLDAVNNMFRIADVRLVLGSAANGGEIEIRDPVDEYLIAQRYLPVLDASGGTGDRYLSYAVSTTQSAVSVPFRTPTRAAITGIVVSSVADWMLFSPKVGASGAPTSIAFNVGGANSSNIVITTVAGTPTIAAGDLVALFPANTNARIWYTGAEL